MKTLFYLLMIITLPVWFPLCIIYGIIVGPIGYFILMRQNAYDIHQQNKYEYEDYLKKKQAGKWPQRQVIQNPQGGSTVINEPPQQPKPLNSLPVHILSSFIIAIPLGVLIGPVNAVRIFWRRMLFRFFPDEILKG